MSKIDTYQGPIDPQILPDLKDLLKSYGQDLNRDLLSKLPIFRSIAVLVAGVASGLISASILTTPTITPGNTNTNPAPEQTEIPEIPKDILIILSIFRVVYTIAMKTQIKEAAVSAAEKLVKDILQEMINNGEIKYLEPNEAYNNVSSELIRDIADALEREAEPVLILDIIKKWLLGNNYPQTRLDQTIEWYLQISPVTDDANSSQDNS